MKRFLWLMLALFLVGCQPQNVGTTVYLLDGENLLSLQSAGSITPASLLARAGLTISEGDRILYNGGELPLDFNLPSGGTYTLQLRRSQAVTLNGPAGPAIIHTTAATVGQALSETGLQLFAADFIDPPGGTPLLAGMTVTYRPARDLSVTVDGSSFTIKSSALTVGQALASAGIALLGLDRSQPVDDGPLPVDGQVRVIRVSEQVTLLEKQIPFSRENQYSTDIPAGTQKVLQEGVPGLAVSRVRIRLEDGVEVSRVTEAETVVRQPRSSIIALGTQVQVQSLDLPGGTIQYWRVVQMYATSYSPCRSGTSKCSSGTASGMQVRQGVVAMVRSLYNQLAGTQVYVTGYGLAVIGDVGGGFPDGRLWIDLAYSDDDYQEWSGMVTVYFLAPAPASIPVELQ